MTAQKTILIVTTSADRLTTDGAPTGLWLEELTTPYYAFHDAGAEVVLASIRGGAIPLDARSLEPEAQRALSLRRFHADPVAQAAVAKSLPLAEMAGRSFDAVFLPGGHGTMADFPVDPVLARIVSETLAAGRVVGAVCHGPAGLLSAVDAQGVPVVRGRLVAGFANSEERAVGLGDEVPFLLETRLRDLGAEYQKGPDFEPFALHDGPLVTGQNPASSAKVAELILGLLG